MATEKITLYDSERDILVEANVSSADAQRAATDIGFATELLQRIINQKSQSSTSTNVDYEHYDCDNDDINEKFITEALDTVGTGDFDSASQESEVHLYRWSPSCVLLLLQTYRSIEETLNSGKLSQKKVWEEIAKELTKKGYNVTGPQCSSKLRSLKKTYKSIKDHNNKSGNDRRNWQFLEIMEEIFAKKAWCNPVAIASSTGLSSKQSERNDSVGESDSGCSLKSNNNNNNFTGEKIEAKRRT